MKVSEFCRFMAVSENGYLISELNLIYNSCAAAQDGWDRAHLGALALTGLVYEYWGLNINKQISSM